MTNLDPARGIPMSAPSHDLASPPTDEQNPGGGQSSLTPEELAEARDLQAWLDSPVIRAGAGIMLEDRDLRLLCGLATLQNPEASR